MCLCMYAPESIGDQINAMDISAKQAAAAGCKVGLELETLNSYPLHEGYHPDGLEGLTPDLVFNPTAMAKIWQEFYFAKKVASQLGTYILFNSEERSARPMHPDYETGARFQWNTSSDPHSLDDLIL